MWSVYFSSIEACGTQLRVGIGLSPEDAAGSWEEVKAPDVANFERARDNLQTPTWLRLGPLLGAAVEASSLIMLDLHKLQDLNPPPAGDHPNSTGLYEDSWLRTVCEDWNHIVANFGMAAQELRQNQVGSTEYKFAVSQMISKPQAAPLQEMDTNNSVCGHNDWECSTIL
jgi:hypothetical protein